jgi:protease II
VLELLQRENDYTKAATCHLDELATSLYEEMLSHIQEDADQVIGLDSI